MKITKNQIKILLTQFSEIYNMQQNMSKCLKGKKTFALDGRFIGDMGECLAGYLYDIDIEETQRPGQDGVFNNKPVEIKVRTLNKNGKVDHIHISDATIEKNGCYLVVLVFDTKERVIKVLINDWLSKATLKKIPRTDKGFVSLANLEKTIEANEENKKLKKVKMSDWTIVYKESLECH